MANGIIMLVNLLTAILIGIMTGRLEIVLVFLLFYASHRTYSGGYHFESRIGCYLCSSLILLIPIYSFDWILRSAPLTVLAWIGVGAITTVVILSPVESIHKRLEPTEIKFFRRVSRCMVSIQACIVVGLFYMDLYEYSYAGYVSIILIAVFMVIGRISTKRYI
ncbi:MAG: accessory regulator AgrB [Clostridia bacterium]|nr:accessory regulator AgrB [Clostridia bacterium]